MWLVPSGVVLVIAMAWAAWAGRPQREETDRSDAAYAKFAQAIVKEHPGCRPGGTTRRAGPQHGDRGASLTRRPGQHPSLRIVVGG